MLHQVRLVPRHVVKRVGKMRAICIAHPLLREQRDFLGQIRRIAIGRNYCLERVFQGLAQIDPRCSPKWQIGVGREFSSIKCAAPGRPR